MSLYDVPTPLRHPNCSNPYRWHPLGRGLWFVAQHYPQIDALVNRWTNAVTDRDDLMAEAVIAASRGMADFDPEYRIRCPRAAYTMICLKRRVMDTALVASRPVKVSSITIRRVYKGERPHIRPAQVAPTYHSGNINPAIPYNDHCFEWTDVEDLLDLYDPDRVMWGRLVERETWTALSRRTGVSIELVKRRCRVAVHNLQLILSGHKVPPLKMEKRVRYRCVECGMIGAGRIGNGGYNYPRRHDCPGESIKAKVEYVK